MGSKRKLAKQILNYILANNPNCNYFYDLFGGGGAVSFEALKRKKLKKVFYNELNTGVVNLLLKIKNDGVTDEFFEWIDRENFNELKKGNSWKSGLVKTCWSFGNQQADYLYGKDREHNKKMLHLAIVNNDKNSIKKLKEDFNIKLTLKGKDINQKRLIAQREIKNQIENIKPLWKNFKEDTKQHRLMEHFQNLQHLSQLEQLERIQQLDMSNLSYEQVKLETPINETIIYLDPPYKNTKQYQVSLDYNKFYEWCVKSPYKIYISSYDMPKDFYLVDSIKHRSTLSATANNEVIENLYCNKKEIYLDRLF